jgi:hypothetical protein
MLIQWSFVEQDTDVASYRRTGICHVEAPAITGPNHLGDDVSPRTFREPVSLATLLEVHHSGLQAVLIVLQASLTI